MRLLALLFVFCSFACLSAGDQGLSAFEEWFKELPRVLIDGIKTQSSPSGQQVVVASRAMKGDETILKVPYPSIITLSTVRQSDIAEFVPKVITRWQDNGELAPAYYECLALFLLYEKLVQGEASLWKHWLNILPQEQDMNNILYWTPAELRELMPSPLYQRAVSRREKLREIYDWHSSYIFKPYPRIWSVRPTLSQYKWAVSIVRSKNFLVDFGDTREIALVPYLDLFRHQPVGITEKSHVAEWSYDTIEETIVVKTTRPYAEGEEVRLNLGQKCNSELLDYYGEMIDDNINDCVHIDVEISESEPMAKEKVVVYRNLRVDSGMLKVTKEGVTSEAIAAIRAVTLSPDELTPSILQGAGTWAELGELAIAEYMVKMCRSLHNQYTLDEEKNPVMMEETLPLRHRLALQLKRGEKEIIKRTGSAYYQHALHLKQEYEKEQAAAPIAHTHGDL